MPRSEIEPFARPGLPGGRQASEHVERMIEMVMIDYHLTPFRAERFAAIYRPLVPRVLVYGAKGYSFYRLVDDNDHFIHTSLWEDRADFQRYWLSREMQETRQKTLGLYEQPVVPGWATILDRG